jgi:MATE family multidrug resistance protein
MMKLFMLFSFFIDGFAFAGEALVGKAIGEQQSAVSGQQSEVGTQFSTFDIRLSTIIRALFAWGTGVGLFFSLLYLLFPEALFSSLTTDREVVDTMHHYLGWLVAMPIVSMLAFMWDGIYVGATRGKEIRNAMLWAAFAFAVTYFLLSTINGQFSAIIGMHALYAAYFAHLAARVIYLTAKFK